MMRGFWRRRAARVAITLAVALPLAGAASEPTLESIFARDWIGTAPEAPYWSDDGKSVYFSRRRPASDLVDLYQIELRGGAVRRLDERERGRADAPGGALSPDRKTKAFVREGDLFVKELGRGALRQLTRTVELESDPLWLTTGRRVAFRRGDGFYAFDLDAGTLVTLADLRLEDDPRPRPGTDFLAEQQRRLFEVLRDRRARADEVDAAARAARASDPTRPPEPWWLGADRALLGAALAPSGRHLAVVLGPRREPSEASPAGAEGGRPDALPVWVTESGYVESRQLRPKVGTGKPETPRIALLDLATGERRDLDLSQLPGQGDDPLAELRRRAASARAGAPADGAAAVAAAPPRPLRLRAMRWNEAGTHLALQLFSEDKKDRWLVVTDGTGTLTPLERQSDPAWLGWRFDDFGWMRDGSTLWFLSEESGYGHLYLRPLAGPRRQLTQGPFEVDHPRLARDGKSFLVMANREHPGIEEAYRVDVASGELTRLTRLEGITHAQWSPDEKQLLLHASSVLAPPELYVQPARAEARAERLTRSTSPEFDAVAWTKPEIVAVPSSHGAGEIWARVYTPPGHSPERTYPAVMFVHGAGYLQNAHHGWSHYFREFMFHTLLARRGYVVIDMDFRASAGYGRAWRTAIYRQMGHPEVEDLADGVAWLVANRGVDRSRIGVYGGSYGGFLTFMAMFRRPELFAAGAALRPVTDWAHYADWYTSAILNTPEVDPDAYRRSSPIEHAAGLAKPLLIAHGMVDDNVPFQDSVRLVQRLIELGKTELFETAIYPAEAHAFVEPSSWIDQYKRIWRLFERELRPGG